MRILTCVSVTSPEPFGSIAAAGPSLPEATYTNPSPKTGLGVTHGVIPRQDHRAAVPGFALADFLALQNHTFVDPNHLVHDIRAGIDENLSQSGVVIGFGMQQ